MSTSRPDCVCAPYPGYYGGWRIIDGIWVCNKCQGARFRGPKKVSQVSGVSAEALEPPVPVNSPEGNPTPGPGRFKGWTGPELEALGHDVPKDKIESMLEVCRLDIKAGEHGHSSLWTPTWTLAQLCRMVLDGIKPEPCPKCRGTKKVWPENKQDLHNIFLSQVDCPRCCPAAGPESVMVDVVKLQAIKDSLAEQVRGAEWRQENEPEGWNGADDEALARARAALK